MTKEKLEQAKALDAKVEYMEMCYTKMELNFPRTCTVADKFQNDVRDDVITWVREAIKEKTKALKAEFKALK